MITLDLARISRTSPDVSCDLCARHHVPVYTVAQGLITPAILAVTVGIS